MDICQSGALIICRDGGEEIENFCSALLPPSSTERYCVKDSLKVGAPFNKTLQKISVITPAVLSPGQVTCLLY